MQGTIFNIQRFSIHDGPGIRTTVFLKGCNLRCFWCHNPESWRLQTELQTFYQKCIGCGKCFAVCPNGCHTQSPQGRVFHRENCAVCGKCAEVCYAEALTITGKEYTVEAVIAEVAKDEMFYTQSGGGVTLSGGEPLLQADFCRELLTGCREKGYHTAVETALHVPWPRIEALLPLVDLWLCDVKAMDRDIHKQATGVDNTLIFRNIQSLSETGANVLLRYPVVPNINDTDENSRLLAEFISKLPRRLPVEPLAFHRMAGNKYISLSREYVAQELEPSTPEAMETLRQTLRGYGVTVV